MNTFVLLTNLADIIFTGMVIYGLYEFFRGTHTATIVKGILLAVGIYILAGKFNFTTLTWIIEKIITNFPIFMVVIFQPELRRFFSNLGQTRKKIVLSQIFTGELSQILLILSKNHTGALIIIEGQVHLDEFIHNGIELDAKFSKELILTIFHSGTPLHDGAVIIRNERVLAAQVFLPTDYSHNTDRGTRHQAGTYITRDHDCIAFMVSEEDGGISYAQNDRLKKIPRKKIEEIIHEILS